MAAAIPTSKANLLALVDTYIPLSPAAPNIRATEHQDLENKILDRVDGRILLTGAFSIANFNGYTTYTVTFSPQTYTNNYIVMLTPFTSSHRAVYSITQRTTSQFKILLYSNPIGTTTYNARFSYVVFSKEQL